MISQNISSIISDATGQREYMLQNQTNAYWVYWVCTQRRKYKLAVLRNLEKTTTKHETVNFLKNLLVHL